MERDLQQLDTIFHMYSIVWHTFRILKALTAASEAEYRIIVFVRSLLFLVFHFFRFRSLGLAVGQ